MLLTPAIAHRPPEVGILKGKGTIRSALASMPAIAYAAIWNVAGNPAAAVPCGLADDGLPVSVQLVGRTDGEPTLLSLAAQVEAARPWPLVAPGRGLGNVLAVTLAIEVEDLTMTYGNLRAVDGVSLDRRGGRVRRHPRPQRRGQDDHAGDHRGPPQAGQRRRSGSSANRSGHATPRCCRGWACSSRPRPSSSG